MVGSTQVNDTKLGELTHVAWLDGSGLHRFLQRLIRTFPGRPLQIRFELRDILIIARRALDAVIVGCLEGN